MKPSLSETTESAAKKIKGRPNSTLQASRNSNQDQQSVSSGHSNQVIKHHEENNSSGTEH
jgi:hypothetical protein